MRVFYSLFALFFVTQLSIQIRAQEQCLPDFDRVDCYPDQGSSPVRCVARGCLWCDREFPEENAPSCHFPQTYGYQMVGEPIHTENGVKVDLLRSTTDTMFGGDIQSLTFEAEFQSDYRLRVKITDSTTSRWEVPLQIDPPSNNATNPLYEIIFTNVPTFSFKILRKSTGTTIFDTSLGGFTFADQFIQIATKLPSENVYGIGENEQMSFRHNFHRFPRFPLWASGHSPVGNLNGYGVHPHYTVVEDEEGNTHAVAIVNSNAQEFEIHSHPGLVYRTTGGILDMYFFLGPTPENCVQQYTEAVGRFPLPPYWALGFHLCKFGYDHIDNLKTVVDRMVASEIPYDVQYGDIDIMDRYLDFTVHPTNFSGLNEYVTQELRSKGIRFMTILDPCISIGEPIGGYRPFDLGEQLNVWVKRVDGTTAQGRMWPPDDVYFPDYSKNVTREWWKILIREFFQNTLEFDALWIDMNEPSNFVPGDVNGCADDLLNEPPYLPPIRDNKLFDNTLCADHVDEMGQHYNTHNLYGWAESEPTLVGATEALGRRTFILSRSTFLGSGRWTTHWLGDNFSRWSNLHASIIGTLQFNLFGMPFTGPDICGHQEDATPELCGRWMQLGAFYPFSRNHNAYGRLDQDPAAFNGTIIEISKRAMLTRYRFLPYLYTLLARHSLYGTTVARPLWHEFPTDNETLGIDKQFLWGSGLLISPALEEGQTVVNAYFPGQARWYDYYTGRELIVAPEGQYFEVPAPFEDTGVIPLHIRGGRIIPLQEPAVNTAIARRNELGLIVALDRENISTGELYFDQGENLNPLESGAYFWADIYMEEGRLTYTTLRNGYPEMGELTFGNITIMGSPQVSSIMVNGNNHSEFEFQSGTNQLTIYSLGLAANATFVVEMM